MMSPLLIEQKSPYNVPRTVELIVSEAEKQNWKIPAVHDLQQTLAKTGKMVMPVIVIELCKPEYAGKVLELNDERAISVFMPCRISVFEKEDGNTYVALMNVSEIADMMPGSVSATLIDAAEGSAAIIHSALEV